MEKVVKYEKWEKYESKKKKNNKYLWDNCNGLPKAIHVYGADVLSSNQNPSLLRFK
jgi:hypothetical protein